MKARVHCVWIRSGIPGLLFGGLFAMAANSASADSDPWERLKDISLAEDDGVQLSLGGEARVRWELWENFGFTEANDDDFGLARLRLHADAEIGERLRVYIEGKSSLATDRDLPGGRRPLDEDSLDLQNAFVDVKLDPCEACTTTLRVGRQELLYGKQRLVSPLDWSNTRRTWEGFRAIARSGSWQLDAFLTEFVPVDRHDFNERDGDNLFYGVYATHDLEEQSLQYDLYGLGNDRGGNGRHFTTGTRIGGKAHDGALDYDVEGAFQFGDVGDDDIEAFFVAAVAGYRPASLPGKTRFSLGYDYASGDDDPEDGEAQTFNQLFPLGHKYLGYIDVVGRRNISALSQGISFWPVDGTFMVAIDHHFFQRAETEDALYNAGGGVVRAGDSGGSSDIGDELDLTLKYILDSHTVITGGYSHFFAGDFIEDSGEDEDIDFAYAAVQYTF